MTHGIGRLLAQLPVPATPAEEVRRIVADVLAGSEYADARPGVLDRVWQAVQRGIVAVIRLLESGGAGSVIGTAVLALAALAVLFGVVRFTRRVQRGARQEFIDVGIAGRTAAEWTALAAEHEMQGRRREAVRCRYRALIARLSEEGLLGEIPGRTAGEYAAAVAADLPAAADAFGQATRTFEQAWYGRAAVTEADLRALAGAVDAVERAAGIAPTAAGARR